MIDPKALRISSSKASWKFTLSIIVVTFSLITAISTLLYLAIGVFGVASSLFLILFLGIPVSYYVISGKAVFLCKDGLKIKSLTKEAFVSSSEIESVSGGNFKAWSFQIRNLFFEMPVTITFKKPTPFGRSVSFMPIWQNITFGTREHEIIQKLNSLIKGEK